MLGYAASARGFFFWVGIVAEGLGCRINPARPASWKHLHQSCLVTNAKRILCLNHYTKCKTTSCLQHDQEDSCVSAPCLACLIWDSPSRAQECPLVEQVCETGQARRFCNTTPTRSQRSVAFVADSCIRLVVKLLRCLALWPCCTLTITRRAARVFCSSDTPSAI